MIYSNINILWSSVIIEIFIRNNIDTFFISPGSRNSALIAAIIYNKKAKANIKITIDERASAFRALGYAKATKKPGVLICTSGTALSNYYPALIEAYRDEIPMIILSADRPSEAVESDANQTINQIGIYGNFCNEYLYLPCPSEDYQLNSIIAKINHIINVKSYPIHINCPFREPLVPKQVNISEKYLKEAIDFFDNKLPLTYYPDIKAKLSDLSIIRQIINNTHKGLVIVGRLNLEENHKAIINFLNQLDWPIFCDIGSSLKWQIDFYNNFFLMDHDEAIKIIYKYDPETIIQFGSSLVSKSYYESILPFLSLKKANIIQICSKKGIRDPSYKVNTRIATFAYEFINEIKISNSLDLTLKKQFLNSIKKLEDAIEIKTPKDILSFPLIASIICENITCDSSLFLGNSITIRAFDEIKPKFIKKINIISNRGVSGIEGNIATALGYAETVNKKLTAVIGDISFIHDLNSLLLLNQSDIPIVLIIINNQGGRIFEHLPVVKFPDILNPYMTTPHNMNFKLVSEQFNVIYFKVSKPYELIDCYKEALDKSLKCIIEIDLCPKTDFEIFNLRKNTFLKN